MLLCVRTAKRTEHHSEYVFALAQTFSTFYNVSSIMNAESPEAAASRLRLARMVRDILKLLLDLLGIEAPEVMLKKPAPNKKYFFRARRGRTCKVLKNI